MYHLHLMNLRILLYYLILKLLLHQKNQKIRLNLMYLKNQKYLIDQLYH